MRLHAKHAILPISLIVGYLFFGLFGSALAIIFTFLWFDKVFLWILGSFGVELVTIMTVLTGITYGPVVGFLFALIVIPLLEGLKCLYIPARIDTVPFFPSPYHLVDGVIAVLAWCLKLYPLIFIIIAALLVKRILFWCIDSFIMTKPINVLDIILDFAFNIILVVYFQSALLGILGL